ncbi:hypothetical protein GGI22_007349, partial [Coemansia erecta]
MPPRTPSPFQPCHKQYPKARRTGKLPACTPSELRRRVSEGEYLVIINGLVCKLNGFIDKHPGGPLAIQHMIGRDATDEVICMHPREVLDDLMPRWAVARFVADASYGKHAVSFVEDMELPYSAARSSSGGGGGDEQHPQPGGSAAAEELDYAAIQRDYRKLEAHL